MYILSVDSMPWILNIYLFILWTLLYLTIMQKVNVGWEACLGLLWMIIAGNRTQDPLMKVTWFKLLPAKPSTKYFWLSIFAIYGVTDLIVILRKGKKGLNGGV